MSSTNVVATIANRLPDFSPEEMKLIKDTVARDATDKELELFLYRCKNMGLDPLKPGQIHFVKYNPNSAGTMIVGIEGFRSIAGRTGKLSGIERGVNRDENGKVVSGWAKVYRSDWTHPAFEEAPFQEFNTGKGPWAKMPETMIKKVAEAAALRMAFPDQVGGVYVEEEMDQAAERRKFAPDQPTSEDGNITEGYRIPAHLPDKKSPVRAQMLPEAHAEPLRQAVASVDAKYASKPAPAKMAEFVAEAEVRVAELEGEPSPFVSEIRTPSPGAGKICPGKDGAHCGNHMMVSKWPDPQTGKFPWYCTKCKIKVPRE